MGGGAGKKKEKKKDKSKGAAETIYNSKHIQRSKKLWDKRRNPNE